MARPDSPSSEPISGLNQALLGLNSGLKGVKFRFGYAITLLGHFRCCKRLIKSLCATVGAVCGPAAKQPDTVATTLPTTDQSTPPQQRGKLVCLVEDNPDVRSVVRQQLIDIGFDVIDTHSADEARRLIPLLPELYGLVSDIMLSGSSNGIELANWLHRRNEHCKIILISGYS